MKKPIIDILLLNYNLGQKYCMILEEFCSWILVPDVDPTSLNIKIRIRNPQYDYLDLDDEEDDDEDEDEERLGVEDRVRALPRFRLLRLQIMNINNDQRRIFSD